MTRARPNRLLVFVCTTAMLSISPSVFARGPAPVVTTEAPSTIEPIAETSSLEVVVAPEVPRADALRQRILDDAERLLDAHVITLGGPRRTRLTIDVSGKGRDLGVTLRVFRDGVLVEPTPAFACECTLEALRARIDRALVELLPTLDEPALAVVTPAVPPPVVCPTPTPAPAPTMRAPRPELGTGGRAGVAAIVIGGGALIGGAVLLLRSPAQTRRDPDFEGFADRTRFDVPGAAVVSAGAVALTIGVVLLAVDRTRARRAARSTAASSHARASTPVFTPSISFALARAHGGILEAFR